MARHARAPPVAADITTPVRRSERNRNPSAASSTPGERFRSLVTACSNYVPVADIVTDPNATVDNVIISPPPTKRKKSNNASSILPSSGIGDEELPLDERKMPAIPEGDDSKMSAIPEIDEADITAMMENLPADDDNHDPDDEDEVAEDDDNDDDFVDNGNELDDDDNILDDDLQLGDDDIEYDDINEDNNANECRVGSTKELSTAAAAAAAYDPDSLFLHADKDASTLLSFFADDTNYEEEKPEEKLKVNNT